MIAAATPTMRAARRRPTAPAVSLLRVTMTPEGAASAAGAQWHGTLNVGQEPSPDGPDPLEALLASLAGCVMRCLRWAADGAHVTFERCELDLATAHEDEPPAVRLIRLELTLESTAPAERVVALVQRALRAGFVTRTVARAVELSVVLRLNGVLHPIEIASLRAR
jgi:uncharacterized OsmC-like protein